MVETMLLPHSPFLNTETVFTSNSPQFRLSFQLREGVVHSQVNVPGFVFDSFLNFKELQIYAPQILITLRSSTFYGHWKIQFMNDTSISRIVVHQ